MAKKKNSELTQVERGKILGLRISGSSLAKIAKTFNIPKSTVHDTIKRYENVENLKSAPRSGRPKLLKVEDQKILKEIALKGNRSSLEEIQKRFAEVNSVKVSKNTIRTNLHELGIFSRIAANKPLLKNQQRENRLKWCMQRRNWTVRQWKAIIWSDESRFKIFRSDGPTRVWRKDGERYKIKNVRPTVKHGGGSVMVWGCFSGKGLGPLVKVDGKMNHRDYIEILDKNLVPLITTQFRSRGYKFQDDNAPVHTARNVQNWIKEKKINVLSDWPSQSPDLNPIEHLWSELERRLKKRENYPKNATELEVAMKEEWSQIPQSVLNNLIESMPRRIEACISNNGWPTEY
jgi:transposase